MLLNNRARDLLDNYTAGMAQHFGTQNPGRYFSLNDPQETALRLAMLESVEFLNWITTLDVDQLSGQVVNVGASVLHTGRSETGRFVRQVGVDGNTYSLVETDSCAALRWDLLSVWANAGKEENEFYNLVQTFSTRRLPWICCVSASTVHTAPKPQTLKPTQMVKMSTLAGMKS